MVAFIIQRIDKINVNLLIVLNAPSTMFIRTRSMYLWVYRDTLRTITVMSAETDGVTETLLGNRRLVPGDLLLR